MKTKKKTAIEKSRRKEEPKKKATVKTEVGPGKSDSDFHHSHLFRLEPSKAGK